MRPDRHDVDHPSTGTVLDDIVANRRLEIAELKQRVPLAALQERIARNDPPRNFEAMLRGPKVKVIAEVKHASPSHGPFQQILDTRVLAQEYSGNGASAISCVTEGRYFGGEGFMIHRARSYMPLPVLRKDFIFDDYQVYESRALEADAILLIVAMLSDLELRLLMTLAHDLGMGVLVETHGAQEIDRALRAGARVIGINNRNLKTMKVDLEHTISLAELVPEDRVLVSESGINGVEDVQRLAGAGVDAVLVGSILMESDDPGWRLRPLTSVDARPGGRPARRDV